MSTCTVDETFGPSAAPCRGDLDFTLLFEESIFTILPTACLLVFALLESGSWSGAKLKVRKHWTASAKLAVITIYGILELASTICWAQNSKCKTRLTLGASILAFLQFIPLLTISYYHHNFAIRPSSFLTLYLTITLCLDAAKVRTAWLMGCDAVIRSLELAAIGTKCFLLVLEMWEKRSFLLPTSEEQTVEQTSSILRHMFSGWLLPLLSTGYHRRLESDDLFGIEDDATTNEKQEIFKQMWSQDSLLKSTKIRLVYVLLKSTWKFMLAPIIPRIILMAATFAQPLLLRRVLQFETDKQQTENIGYALIAAMGLVYTILALSKAEYDHMVNSWVMEIRNLLVSMVYQKSLVVDLINLKDGTMSTLLNVDMDLVLEGFKYAHEIWAGAAMLGIASWLIYTQLGYAFIAPLLVMVALTILTTLLSPIVMKAQSHWLLANEGRIEATSGIINSMKGIKMMGIGENLFKDIHRLREVEVEASKSYRKIYSTTLTISNGVSVCANLAAFATFAIISSSHGRTLNTVQLFTSLSLLTITTAQFFILLQAIPGFASGMTCLGRIYEFLVLPTTFDNELERNTAVVKGQSDISNNEKGAVLMAIKNGSFGHSDVKAVLHTINVKILRGNIHLLIGPVGCGKSSLLKSFLGETRMFEGEIRAPSESIAYCEQNPWLINGTLRANILGVSDYDKAHFETVVSMCALRDDISKMPKKDLTVVGSKGFGLSGGQRQRIALARAIYSKAKIIILDDIFSGLDGPTEDRIGGAIFGANGALSQGDITVIFATHSVKWLPYTDRIISMEAGHVIRCGSFDNLKATPGAIRDLILQQPNSCGKEQTRKSEIENSLWISENALIEPESLAGGRSREWSIYGYYAASLGLTRTIVYLFRTFASAGVLAYQNVWLENWASSEDSSKTTLYIGVYAGLAIAALVLFFLMCFQLFCVLIPRSGIELHRRQLRSLMSAPLAFIASSDAGKLLNRFSQDIMLIDNELPRALLNTMGCSSFVLGSLIVVLISSPFTGITLPILLPTLYFLQRFYMRTSRQLRYLDLETKGPLYSNFAETFSGLTTIRAFGWTSYYKAKNNKLLQNSQKPMFLLFAIQIWLQMVLDLTVAGLVVVVMVIAVILRNKQSTGFLGLALFNLISLGQALTQVIKNWTLLETSIAAVSRVREISCIPAEEITEGKINPPDEWPTDGELEFRGCSSTYSSRPGAEETLKDISFKLASGKKLAIIGRSGSGKSSIIGTLLAILTLTKGSIHISNHPTSTIPLHHLRSSITLLPQDPVFIPGTFRHNLCTWSSYSDMQLQDVLQKVELWKHVCMLGGLDAICEPERAFSQGQRQVFCLARICLRSGETRLLVVDEATSSVDKATDILMQGIIRTEFSHATILAVVHRLDTILDFDHVLVMQDGRVVKFVDLAALGDGQDLDLAGLYDT